jgi:hypothetical protein
MPERNDVPTIARHSTEMSSGDMAVFSARLNYPDSGAKQTELSKSQHQFS